MAIIIGGEGNAPSRMFNVCGIDAALQEFFGDRGGLLFDFNRVQLGDDELVRGPVNRGDGSGFAVDFVDGDSGVGHNAQGHILEFVTASCGKTFLEAFVIDIDRFNPGFGNGFGAIGAARIGDRDMGVFGFTVITHDAVDFGMNSPAAVADADVLAKFLKNDVRPRICARAHLPPVKETRGHFAVGVRAGQDDVDSRLRREKMRGWERVCVGGIGFVGHRYAHRISFLPISRDARGCFFRLKGVRLHGSGIRRRRWLPTLRLF